MASTPDQQYRRVTGLQSECSVGLVVTGVLVTTLGIASAALLPICYMFYAQQTALGLLFTITGILSFATSPNAVNFAAKSGVVMTLHILSWITLAYIVQVALNLITGSFYPDRSLSPTECGYSYDSSDEIIYYSLGGISLLLGVIYLVLSIFVFVAFWKDFRPPSTQVTAVSMVQPTYQLQAVGGYNNGGFVQDPIRDPVMQAPTYSAEPRPNPPLYTATQPTQHVQIGSVHQTIRGTGQGPSPSNQDDMNKLD